MTLEQLLKRLNENRISLSLKNGELVIRGAKENLTDDIKKHITDRQRELVIHLQKKNSPSISAPATTIPLVPHTEDGYPLSWYQERLWVFNQKNPTDLSYNVPVVFSVEGELNIEAFEKSLNLILSRHESIRTCFRTNDQGEPRQYVNPHQQLSLDVKQIKKEEAGVFIEEMLRHVFDLKTGPLFVPKLLRISATEHVFIFNIHHICSDAWSIRGILFKELQQSYASFCFKQQPALPPLRIQYKDFSVWQRELDVSTQLPYWKNALAGYEDTLKMPSDFPRTPNSGQNSQTYTRHYSKTFSKSLERFSQQHDSTMFISLLAGFAVAVNRYCGKDDLCIGTTVAGRSLVELEPLIGFLVNILPLRIHVQEDVTVKEYLSKVRKLTLDGFDNQMVAFEQILYSMGDEYRGKSNPLVPLVIRHQNFPHAQMNAPLPGDVRFVPYGGAGSNGDTAQAATDVAARCEMELSYTGNADELELSIAYASDLFLRETIDRLLDNHQYVLEQMFENEQLRLSELSVLSEADVERITVSYNQTEVPLPTNTNIVERFNAQVTQTPNAVACYDQEGEWQYREIATHSNRLAHGLIDRGVQPGDVVGICLHRGAPLLSTMLGIWKAGAAYVPLDPVYPSGYLSQILEDVSPRLIVCTTQTAQKLNAEKSESTKYNTFALDATSKELASLPDAAPAVEQTDSSLAYVMYTSGSTGKPKGVKVPHRQLNNWLGGLETRWPFAPGEVIAQKTTMAFAVSVKEIFAGLVNGCAVVFFDTDTVHDTVAFVETLAKYNVSRMNLVPSHLLTVLEYLQRQGATLPSFKLCITAGEPLTPEVVKAVRARLPQVTLLNNYGCTELNDICYFDATDYEAKMGFVPIGKPVQNTKLYILDRQGRLVPEGVPGQLHVATLGMSHGYHNLEELTKERFIANPFADAPYDVMYNTGDVVKYLPDGNIEFLGRWDFEVKVRGFRVDVRQVEKVLGDFPGMGQRAVMGEGEQLIAYYVSKEGGETDLNTLRSFFQKRLPTYMVPDAFVKLSQMPKLPNGKMNRKALKTSQGELQQSSGYEAPQTPTEETVAQIWSEVLEIPTEQIGRQTHFFETGGHSLAATRVVARIKDKLQVEIGLSAVFENPMLLDFSAYVEKQAPDAIEETASTSEWTLRVEETNEPNATGSKLLNNKVCLVTGASRGIGQATARLLASHGAKVAINYLGNEGLANKVKAQIEREGGVAEVFQADVTNAVQVKRMVQSIQESLGEIDVLVANAAIRFSMAPFVEHEWDDFNQKVSGELKAMFYPCQAVLPGMIKRRNGSIVAISSGLSKHTGDGFISHSTAKAALDAFVRGLAHEAGPHSVRVNTVAPGVVLTDATANFTPEHKEGAAAAVPLRRNALPHDIAGAVLFAASDLSQYMTGCYLPVDGGFTML